MKTNVIIAGSGISGLSIAQMLKETHTVRVLEKEDKIGGLIKCSVVEGNLYHLVGGHVFNSRNQAVLDWFWHFFDRDKEFLKATRNARILLEDQLIGYPIENYIYQLLPPQVEQITTELLDIYTSGRNPRQSESFAMFLKQSFGETLFDLYFEPYNKKIWNTALDKIPLDWLDDKLPMPLVKEILVNNIIKKKDSATVHATFYYPVQGGSQFIVNRLAEHLSIETSTEIKTITVKNNKIFLNGGSMETDRLVYCGDIRKLCNIIQIADEPLLEALQDLKNLLSTGTTTVLCECDENDMSWLYLPEKKFKAHRIIYTGNFSSNNNSPAVRKTCVVEFSGLHNQEDTFKEVQLLPGNLRPISYNYEANSYIIQQADTRQKIKTARSLLEKYHIYLLGRFSEWEYYNMDKCIESAMHLQAKLME